MRNNRNESSIWLSRAKALFWINSKDIPPVSKKIFRGSKSNMWGMRNKNIKKLSSLVVFSVAQCLFVELNIYLVHMALLF